MNVPMAPLVVSLHTAYRLDPTPTKDSHSEDCQPAGSWCLPVCVASWACRDQGRRGGCAQVPLEPQGTELGAGSPVSRQWPEGGPDPHSAGPLACPGAALGTACVWVTVSYPRLPPAPSVRFGIFQVSLIRAHKRPEQHGCSTFS